MRIYSIIPLILIALFTVGCQSPWKYLPSSPGDLTTIYVANHGWHTGLIVKEDDLSSDFGFIKQSLGPSPYYELGWGDKGFYQSKEITSWLTFKAIFWPTASVMHIVAVPMKPADYFPHSKVLEVPVSKQAITHLNNYLANSFQYDTEGRPIKSKKGIYGNSLFYEAAGCYYMTNTCNTWTARALKQAGMPIGTFLTLTAGSVMSQTQDAVDQLKEPQ